MDFIFETFGGRDAGSSRLRAWKLADELRVRGHAVWTGTPPARASEDQVWIFQKRRNAKLLARAKEGGATAVFDFDDNYLLDTVGTRKEIVAFMNECDLVTVGSRRLWEAASRLHEFVWLFENPLDIEREGLCRSGGEWKERLVWFGNRTNLPALEALDLPREVTTITKGGDIEWDVHSIDNELCNFDLALIPVERSEWRDAKNANRLLKCIALGLPALVSSTEEHLSVATRLGLPTELIVEEDVSWDSHISAVRDDYCAVREAVLDAREVAFEEWGITKTVDSWLERVMRSHVGIGYPGVRSIEARRRRGGIGIRDDRRNLDVLVVGDGPVGDWRHTVKSVFAYCEPGRVAVVSYGQADPGELSFGGVLHHAVSDPFEMYSKVSELVRECDEEGILVVRAGSEVRPGFMEEFRDMGKKYRTVGVFSVQVLDGTLHVQDPPRFLQEVLVQPYMPACWFVSGDLRVAIEGDLARYGALMPWFIVIQSVYEWSSDLECVLGPVVGAYSDGISADPVCGYWEFLRGSGSEAGADLPKSGDEWRRLLRVWNTSVVEDCKDAFGAHAASAIPQLQSGMFEPGAKGKGKPKSDGRGRLRASDQDSLGVSGIRTRAVRFGWVCLRSFIPATVRERMFRRFKDTYYSYFPERLPSR